MTVLRSIYKLEEWQVSRITAVHGLVTNLALGITPLLERQPSRHIRPAIGTFVDDHRFTGAPVADNVRPDIAADRFLASWQINYRGRF